MRAVAILLLGCQPLVVINGRNDLCCAVMTRHCIIPELFCYPWRGSLLSFIQHWSLWCKRMNLLKTKCSTSKNTPWVSNEDPDFAAQNCLKVWKREAAGQECLIIAVIGKGWILIAASKDVFCDTFFFFYSIYKVEGLNATLFLCSLNSERQNKKIFLWLP